MTRPAAELESLVAAPQSGPSMASVLRIHDWDRSAAHDAEFVHGYELREKVGAGAEASVFLARHIELDRMVAVKRASTEGRLRREARIAASLSHPNIATVHDYFEERGFAYIVMEYAAGGSLCPCVRELSVAQVGLILEAVLAGLAHAEEVGVVHCDLKPGNLLVGDDTVKIADFGIARSGGSRISHTVDEGLRAAGTPHYMAPEQALGGDVGPWTDLYALGTIAFELLAGELPFESIRSEAVLQRKLLEPAPELARARPIDPLVCAWVDRMLAKSPADRVRSPRAAVEELDAVMVQVVGPGWREDAALPARPPSRPRGRRRHRRSGPVIAVATQPIGERCCG